MIKADGLHYSCHRVESSGGGGTVQGRRNWGQGGNRQLPPSPPSLEFLQECKRNLLLLKVLDYYLPHPIFRPSYGSSVHSGIPVKYVGIWQIQMSMENEVVYWVVQ